MYRVRADGDDPSGVNMFSRMVIQVVLGAIPLETSVNCRETRFHGELRNREPLATKLAIRIEFENGTFGIGRLGM